MKNLITLGMPALALITVAVILATITGCSLESGPNPGGSSNGGVSMLNLSGRVHNDLNMKRSQRIHDTYQQFNPGRQLIVYSNLGVTGIISSAGQLSFTIGTPGNQYLGTQSELIMIIANMFTDNAGQPIYTITSFLPSDTLLTYLELESEGFASSHYFSLSRQRHTGTVNQGHGSGVDEDLFYVFVNKDVTVTMQGRTVDSTTYQNANLSLRQGWNGILIREQWNITPNLNTSTITLSVGNPGNLLWVVFD
jgi:hypothetical protein